MFGIYWYFFVYYWWRLAFWVWGLVGDVYSVLMWFGRCVVWVWCSVFCLRLWYCGIVVWNCGGCVYVDRFLMISWWGWILVFVVYVVCVRVLCFLVMGCVVFWFSDCRRCGLVFCIWDVVGLDLLFCLLVCGYCFVVCFSWVNRCVWGNGCVFVCLWLAVDIGVVGFSWKVCCWNWRWWCGWGLV